SSKTLSKCHSEEQQATKNLSVPCFQNGILRFAQNDMRGVFLSNLQSNQARTLPIAPALERLAHLRFGIDSQGVGDAVDIVEVGDHFDRVQDIPVGEPVLAQGL